MESYQDKFNEVLKYIHLNMDEPLDLDVLSQIALVSKYHFHRMIKIYLGESLGAYITRIRIEKGARLLKYSSNSISQIAYKIGYETPTSFTKGFKKQFGVSPSKYRKEPNHSFEIVKNKKQKTDFCLIQKLESFESTLILTNQSKGRSGSDAVQEVWADLMSFAQNKKLLSRQTKMYSIHWDDPSVTKKHNLRYDACISVDIPFVHPAFPIKKLEGGRYMTFVYQGDYNYLGDVYDQIFHDYILKQNIRLRDAPLFDQFLNDVFSTSPKDLLTKIFVPI